MEIDIIGAGSIGLLFAAKLASASHPVTVRTRTGRQADELRGKGVTLIRAEGGPINVPVDARPLTEQGAEDGGKPRTILLTVKQPDITEELVRRIGVMASAPESLIVCLQNGIGHMERLTAVLPEADVLAGVTTEGARRLDDHTVEHTGSGEVRFGPWRYPDEKGRNLREPAEFRQKMFLDALRSAGFRAFLSNDMEDRIYQKLLINAVINPLTAIYDVRNGELPNHPFRLRLMKALYEETHAVLTRVGYSSGGDDWQRITEVCRATAGNVSSMLSDARAGRVTEVDWINGGIAKLAERSGMRAPLNESAVRLVRELLPPGVRSCTQP